MTRTFIVNELKAESKIKNKKTLEYGIQMKTKTDSYLDSKFKLHS